MSKLNIGCGKDVKKGYVNADLFPQVKGIEKADILSLPFSDGSFEEILALDIVEHVSWRDTDKALAEIARVLAPGGKAEIRVPDLDALQDLRKRIGDREYVRRIFGDQNVQGNYHYGGFTKETLHQHLQKAGLTIVKEWVKNGNRGVIVQRRRDWNTSFFTSKLKEGPAPIDIAKACYKNTPIIVTPTKPDPRPDLMRPIAIIGGFKPRMWGEMPNEKYFADALEDLGRRVVRVNEEENRWRKLIPARSIVVMTRAQQAKHTDLWRRMKCTIVFRTLDAPTAFRRQSSFTAAARASDIVISSADWGMRGQGKKKFARLPAACIREDFPFDPKPVRSVAFLGILYTGRRRKIAEIIKNHNGDVRHNWDRKLYRGDLARYVQNTKIIIGDNWTNDVEGYWSSRNYIIPGRGGFLLTARVPGLEKEFEIGKHLAVWDSIDDLKAKIKYYLEHDKEREAIRRAGWEHVNKNHSWDVRAREFLEIIAEYE